MKANELSVCNKFKKILNDEIAAGEYFQDYALEQFLKSKKVYDEAKSSMGIPKHIEISAYDLTKPSLDALPKFRFIYLVSLFEAFVKEYIARHYNLEIEDVNGFLKKNTQGKWQSVNSTNNHHIRSTSVYNINYVIWLFDNLFSIQIKPKLNPLTVEMGYLRKCLVHRNGEINTNDFVEVLKITCSKCGVPAEIGSKLKVTKEMMTIYIEDFRKILKICDY